METRLRNKSLKILVIIGDLSFSMKTGRQEAVVAPVGDGESALAIARRSSPDLVILDASLPGMDIPSLIGRFRRFSDAPIVVMSESESGADRARCLNAGADEYLQCLPGKAEIEEMLRRKSLRGLSS